MKILKILLMTAVGLAVLAAGCENHMQMKRDEAKARWADSRAEMLTKFAQGAYARGEMTKARDQVDEAIRLTPKYAPLYVLAARLALEKGEPDTALTYARTAWEIDAKSAEALYVLGTAEQAMGHMEKALAAFAEAAATDPDGDSYVLAQAEALVAMDRIPEAAEKLQAAVSRMPGRASVHMAYGDLLFMSHEYDQAAGSYRVARRLDPKRAEAGERLGAALYYSGSYEEAESVLCEASESRKDAGPAWMTRMRAECLMALGRADQARNLLSPLAKTDTESAETLLGLAKCDVLQKQPQPAREKLEAALARQPSHAEANALLGYLLIEAGRPGEAIPHLQLALKSPALPGRETVERLLAVATRRAGAPGKSELGEAPHPSGGAAMTNPRQGPEAH